MLRTAMLALFTFAMMFVVLLGPLPHTEAAPIPKHLMKEPKNDKEKFQGKWKVESIKMGGSDLLANLGQAVGQQGFDMTIEFAGDQFRASANIGGTSQTSTAIVKFGEKGTKQLTTTKMQTTVNGQQTNQESDHVSGYAFDGDKLLLASRSNGEKKAADPLKPGPDDVVITLVRVK